MSDLTDKLEKELNAWRAKLEEMRVQANLGKLELRERHPELFEDFESAYRNAKVGLGGLKESGKSAASAVVDGLEAGWDELRRAYERKSGKK